MKCFYWMSKHLPVSLLMIFPPTKFHFCHCTPWQLKSSTWGWCELKRHPMTFSLPRDHSCHRRRGLCPHPNIFLKQTNDSFTNNLEKSQLLLFSFFGRTLIEGVDNWLWCEMVTRGVMLNSSVDDETPKFRHWKMSTSKKRWASTLTLRNINWSLYFKSDNLEEQ